MGNIAGHPHCVSTCLSALAKHSSGAFFLRNPNSDAHISSLMTTLRISRSWVPTKPLCLLQSQIALLDQVIMLLLLSLPLMILLFMSRSVPNASPEWLLHPVPSNQPQIFHPQHMTLTLIFLSRLRSPSENSLSPPPLATCRSAIPALSHYLCTFAYPPFFPPGLEEKTTFLHITDPLSCALASHWFSIQTRPYCHASKLSLSSPFPHQ